jgi:hypothetical protein
MPMRDTRSGMEEGPTITCSPEGDTMKTFRILLLVAFVILVPCSVQLSAQPLTDFSMRLVETDGQEWTLTVPHDSLWHHYAFPLSAFGTGSGFLDTPVRTIQIIPVGGSSLNGHGTEVVDWIDQILLRDTLVDDFEEPQVTNWYQNLATNGSYLQVNLDGDAPPGMGHSLRLVHGNSMWTIFSGWMEKRYAGIALTFTDTLKFWLKGYSYPLTSVADRNIEEPKQLRLYQNYPNPFNPSTSISYDLASSGRVVLTVLNILGEEVRTLVDGVQQSGYHNVAWGPDRLPGGIYFARLQTNHEVRTLKLLYLK